MSRPEVVPYNSDKPHRCPSCHAVTLLGEGRPLRLLTFASVTCCRCGTEFSRTPRLVLRRRGVLCTEHGDVG